jgi:hypothetical protein
VNNDCPVCGTPILTIVVHGPTPAERYAQPCGHRLPADFENDDGDGEEQDADAWAEQLAEQAADGGGCLETAELAATEREESRRGVVKGFGATLATLLGVGVGTTSAGARGLAPGIRDDDDRYRYECSGSIDTRCLSRAALAGGAGCYLCRVAPSHKSCVPCAAILIAQGDLAVDNCCTGRWERVDI